MAKVYLGLGANLGNRIKNMSRAIQSLAGQATILQVSSVYETEPVGYTEQPDFLNAVIAISTGMNPEQLLQLIKEIERSQGRTSSFHNAPRPVDIDILFINDRALQSKQLIVPHPRLTERAFVLVPLAEIAPGLRHPENGKTMKELLEDLGTITGIRKWAHADRLWDRRQHVSGIR
jgi:2-amino-4-hydroxy-6-hydroxymethyldihydropteridine diphosphokinase